MQKTYNLECPVCNKQTVEVTVSSTEDNDEVDGFIQDCECELTDSQLDKLLYKATNLYKEYVYNMLSQVQGY